MTVSDGIAIFVGGMAGTALRFGATSLAPGDSWPATLFVNLLGAAILGFLLEALTSDTRLLRYRRSLRLAVGTGLLSSLTTYSTFAYEVVGLGWLGVFYGVGTVVGGVLAALAGIALGKAWAAR